MHYVKRTNLIVWLIFIVVFYLLLSKIDLIVHYDLYNYGLQFSLAWAQPYWAVLALCFWTLAALSVASYLLESRSKNPYLALLIALTILIPYHFGFEDIIFFILQGQFPPNSVAWTWYPLNEVFPPWNTEKHIIFAISGFIILVSIWVIFLLKRWVTFNFTYLKKYKVR